MIADLKAVLAQYRLLDAGHHVLVQFQHRAAAQALQVGVAVALVVVAVFVYRAAAGQVGLLDAHAAEVVVDEAGATWVSHCGWNQGGLFLAPLSWSADQSSEPPSSSAATLK